VPLATPAWRAESTTVRQGVRLIVCSRRISARSSVVPGPARCSCKTRPARNGQAAAGRRTGQDREPRESGGGAGRRPLAPRLTGPRTSHRLERAPVEACDVPAHIGAVGVRRTVPRPIVVCVNAARGDDRVRRARGERPLAGPVPPRRRRGVKAGPESGGRSSLARDPVPDPGGTLAPSWCAANIGARVRRQGASDSDGPSAAPRARAPHMRRHLKGQRDMAVRSVVALRDVLPNVPREHLVD